jgi:hypothetical protein
MSYSMLAVILLLIAIALIIAVCCWHKLNISSKPPPTIDDDGEDWGKRLDIAVKQYNTAGDELQAIIRQILAENDRLRQEREESGNAPGPSY